MHHWQGAHMQGACMQWVHMHGGTHASYLRNADASLTGAHTCEHEARMQGACLQSAHMHGVRMRPIQGAHM